jgi:hypothetical protein
MMDMIVPAVKYIFVAAAAVEVALILRALIALALGKARSAQQLPRTAEE